MRVEEFREAQETGRIFEGAKVDRSLGMIQNVALLGKHSKNGRRYSEKAMRDAARLYEGVPFMFDHPTDKQLRQNGGSRSVLDIAGRIRNPRVAGDQVRGDIEVLNVEPSAPFIFAVAEQMPGIAGNSHRASGNITKGKDGSPDVVEGLDRVFAVELVADPATTQGLFESCWTHEAKGDEGDMTGAAARRLIQSLMDKGMTQDDIGNVVGRDASVISAILDGDIENPPESLIRSLRALNGRTPQGRESVMDFTKITLAELSTKRPDLLIEHDQGNEAAQQVVTLKADNEALKEKNDALETADALREREDMIGKKLEAAKLPEAAVSETFRESLTAAKDEAAIDALITDRKELVGKVSKKGGPISHERTQESTEPVNGFEHISEEDMAGAVSSIFH